MCDIVVNVVFDTILNQYVSLPYVINGNFADDYCTQLFLFYGM